jgi:hypothetical protein
MPRDLSASKHNARRRGAERMHRAARRPTCGSFSPADNELGWRISIDKLAALVEAG